MELTSQRSVRILVLCSTIIVSAMASVPLPTVTGIVGSPLDLSKLAKDGKETITLQGTGLNSVTGINLILGGTTLSYKPQPATPADPTKLQFEIDETKPPTVGTYSITLDTAAQKGISINSHLEVVSGAAAPTVTGIEGSPVYLDKLKTAGKVTVTLQGTGLDSVTGINLTLSATTLSFKPQPATPPDSTKLQFEIDETKPPAVGKYSITLDTATQKALSVNKVTLEVAATEAQPIVKSITGSPLSLVKLAKDGKETIALTGTGLDAVVAVNFVPQTSGKTLTYKPQPTTPADSTKLQFEIDSTSPPAVGTYSVTLDTSTDKGISTGKTFRVSAQIQPSVVKLIGSPLSLAKLAKDRKETVTLVGTSLDGVTAVNFVPKKTGGKTLTYKPIQPQISTKTQVVIDTTAVPAPSEGEYSVTVNTGTTSGISTTVSLVITP
jgi:hypothetical protein